MEAERRKIYNILYFKYKNLLYIYKRAKVKF